MADLVLHCIPFLCFWACSQFLLQSSTTSPNLKISSQRSIFFSEPPSLNNLGLSGFLSPSLLFFFCCHECFCSFIDFLPLNYIHVFCVGSLCRCLCVRDWGGFADSCQTDLWWGAGTQGKPQTCEVHDAFLLATAAHILAPIRSHIFFSSSVFCSLAQSILSFFFLTSVQLLHWGNVKTLQFFLSWKTFLAKN